MSTIVINDNINDLLVKYDRDDSIKIVLSNDPDNPTPYPVGVDYILRFYNTDYSTYSEYIADWDVDRKYATIYVPDEDVNQFFDSKPAGVRLIVTDGDDSTVIASGKIVQKKYGDDQ